MENQFGKYTLLKKLGDGGMAEVFLAEMKGPEGFSKLVAIKRILPHLCHDALFTESFINEARLGGYLNHHNIVQTLDFGQIDGFYYLAMEYVQGVNLRQILKDSQHRNAPIPLSVGLDIAHQICEGLAYAHTATDAARRPLKMIHRDLKPSNILINSHGVVKIADFGVARAESNVAHTQLASGNPKGTVAYMSPEQAMGLLDIDQRADVFSLGAILFELLCSQRIYTASTYLGALRQAQDAEISDRLAIADGITRDSGVSTLLRRALAPEPDKRYRSSKRFAKELRRTLVDHDSDFSLSDYLLSAIPRIERRENAPAGMTTSQQILSKSVPQVLSTSGNIGAVRPSKDPLATGGLLRTVPPSRGPASAGPPALGAFAGAAGLQSGAAPQMGVIGPHRSSQPPSQVSNHSANPAQPVPTRTLPARGLSSAEITSPGPAPSPTRSYGAPTLNPKSTRTENKSKASPGRASGILKATVASIFLLLAGVIVTYTLLPHPSSIVVKASPENAKINLPDGSVLSSPATVAVDGDGMRLVVTLDGYQGRQLDIPGDVPKGQIWKVQLEPSPPELKISVQPPNTKLTILGKNYEGQSQYNLSNLPPNQSITVLATAEGFSQYTTKLQLKPGESSALTISLEKSALLPTDPVANRASDTTSSPRKPPTGQTTTSRKAKAAQSKKPTGFLACNALPKSGGSMWAKIFVDGNYVGNTPMLKHTLPVGEHELRLVAEDGQIKKKSITVKKGKTTRVLMNF